MNSRIYWNLKHLPEDEKPEYLRGLGLSEEQIADLLLDMKQNSFTYREETRQPFTESEEWREIQRRIGELTSHEMRDMRGELPAQVPKGGSLRTLPGGNVGEGAEHAAPAAVPTEAKETARGHGSEGSLQSEPSSSPEREGF